MGKELESQTLLGGLLGWDRQRIHTREGRDPGKEGQPLPLTLINKRETLSKGKHCKLVSFSVFPQEAKECDQALCKPWSNRGTRPSSVSGVGPRSPFQPYLLWSQEQGCERWLVSPRTWGQHRVSNTVFFCCRLRNHFRFRSWRLL